MKSTLFIASVVALSLAVSGCSRAVSRQTGKLVSDLSAAKVQAETVNEYTTVVSQNGAVQIETPSTWYIPQSSVEQPNMILQVNSQHDKVQLGVQAFPKADYAHMNSDLAVDAIIGMAQAATGGEGTVEPTSLTAINGLPASQYEGQGLFAGYPITALATAVESSDAYYAILAVGSEADFNQMRGEIEQVIQSFQPISSTTQP